MRVYLEVNRKILHFTSNFLPDLLELREVEW